MEKKRALAARKGLGGLARAAEARNTPDTWKRSDYSIRRELRASYKGIPQHPLNVLKKSEKKAVSRHVSSMTINYIIEFMKSMSSDNQTGIYCILVILIC